MFIIIEDETRVTNLVLWADCFEAQQRLVLSAGMIACHGRVQRAGEVIHVVTDYLEDLSDLLRSVGTGTGRFPWSTAGATERPMRRPGIRGTGPVQASAGDRQRTSTCRIPRLDQASRCPREISVEQSSAGPSKLLGKRNVLQAVGATWPGSAKPSQTRADSGISRARLPPRSTTTLSEEVLDSVSTVDPTPGQHVSH